MSRQNTDYNYIDLGYFTPEEYFVYTANAEAAANSSATMSCDATRIAGGQVVLGYSDVTAFATVACTISHIEGADMFAFSDANLAIEVSRIRDNNIEASSAFSIAASGVRTLTIAANAPSVASLSTDNLRVRYLEAAVNAAFSLISTAGLIKAVSSSLSSISSVNADLTRVRTVASAMNAVASLNASAVRIRTSAVALSSTVSSNILARKTVVTTSAMSALAFEIATVFKITRNVGDPIVVQGGNYGGLAISSTRSKFGAASLKFDSKTWATFPLSSVLWGNSEFVVLSWDERAGNPVYVSKSTNGTTWTRSTTNLTSIVNTTAIEYHNGQYVFWNSNTLYYSSDAITWTSASWATSGIPRWNASLSRWVRANQAVSRRRIDNIQTATTINGSYSSVVSLSDLYTTTGIKNGSAAFAFKGSSTVIVGFDSSNGSASPRPRISHSSNTGATWNTSTFGSVDNTFYDVACDGTTFVAVGGLGIIYTSTDGVTWTQRTSGTTDAIFNIQFLNNRWIATGGDFVLTSSNAITWTLYSNTGTSSNDKPSFGAGYYYAGSNVRTTDSTLWRGTLVDYSTPNQAPYILFNGNSRWSSWQTLDFWIYPESGTNLGSQYKMLEISQAPSATSNLDTDWWVGFYTPNTAQTKSRVISVIDNSLIQGSTSGDINFDAWNHIRISRNNSSISIYLNGSRLVTGSVTTKNTESNPLWIGGESFINYNIYLDEVLITNELLTNPSSTTYTVPTQAYVNNNNTSLLLHFDSAISDDNLYPPQTLEAQANLTSAFTLTQVNTNRVSASASLSAVCTVNANVRRIRNVSSAVSSQATVSAVIGLRQQGQSALSSEASVTANPVRRTAFASAVNSSATLNAVTSRTRNLGANFAAIATELAAIGRIGQGFINMDVRASLTANGRIATGSIVSMSSQATVSATALRIKQISSAFASLATLQASVVKAIIAQAALASVASITANNSRTRTASAAFSAFAFEVAVTRSIDVGNSNMSVVSQLSVTATVTRTTASVMNSVATVASTATVTRTTRSTMAAVAIVTATISHIEGADLQAFTNATLSITAKVTKPGQAVMSSTATASIIATKIPGFNRNELTAIFTVSANGKRTRNARSNFFCSAGLIVGSTTLKQGKANLQVQGFTVTIGDVIHITPYLTYKIASEDRSYTIQEESRVRIIDEETRIYIIKE
jgi:hypothetical protein